MKGYRGKRYPFLPKTMSKCAKRSIEKSWKKVLTNWNTSGKMVNVAAETAKTSKKDRKTTKKLLQKKLKKLLTNIERCDILSKLLLRQQHTNN